jgi:hypothetical protein
VTTQPTNPLIAARRNDSDRRRRKVLDALDRLRTGGDEITVSAVARTAGFSELRIPLRPCGFRLLCVWQAEVDGGVG